MHHFPLALVVGCHLAAWCAPASQSTVSATAPVIAASVETAIEAASADIDAGRPADAVSLLRPLLASHSEDRRIVLVIARAYRRLDATGDAIDVLLPWVHAHPGDVQAQLALAEAHAANRDYASSEDDVRAALAVSPHDSAALVLLGEALALQRRDAEALAAYDAALRSDPRSAAALVGRALIESEAGDDDRASSDYRHALSIRPDDVEALDGLAHLELTRDRPYEARRLAARAQAIAPSDGDAHDLFALASAGLRPRLELFSVLGSAADSRVMDNGVDLWLGSLGAARVGLRFDELRLGDEAYFARRTRGTTTIAYDLGDHLSSYVTMSTTSARAYGGVELAGRWRHLALRVDSSTGAIDAAEDSSDGRIYPAAATLPTASSAISAVIALGSFDLSGGALARSYGDGNRFAESNATISRRVGGNPYAPLRVVAGVRDGGFAMNRSWYAAVPGYYDYLRRRDSWLGFDVRFSPPRAAARGGMQFDVGTRRLTNLGGTVDASFERIAPYVDVGTEVLRLRASAYRASYVGSAPYPGYGSTRLELRADLRL